MHILIIEGIPTLLAGGQERSLFEVIRGLTEEGHAVTLAHDEDGELLPVYHSLGVHTFRIETRSLALRHGDRRKSMQQFLATVWAIRKEYARANRSWNAIYINQYMDSTLAAVCGILLRLPVVCHLRLAAPTYLSRQFRWALGRCSALICNSRYTAETYRNVGLDSGLLKVIHNGIDSDEFRPLPAPDARPATSTRTILYVGRLAPEKGIEVLLEAMSKVLAVRQDVSLRIFGNPRGADAGDAYRLELVRRGEALLGDRVDFQPAVPDVACLYRAADVTVLPAVWDEPFGRVVIESMACGVPCIASRTGGIPEVLHGPLERLLFDRGSADQLAQRILALIDWRTSEPGLGRECRARVEKEFSIPRVRRDVSQVLADCASAVPTRA